MHSWNRSIILAFSFILVLAVSAMAVQPALADDSTPPPPSPSTGSVSSSPTSNNLPAKVPAGTDVVVLDRSGNSVPLASQKAAQIVASGDPLWCPKGVAPKSSVGGCSPASTDFLSLETWLYANNKPKAGAIWIAGGYNSHYVEPGMSNLTLDGSMLTNMSNYSLDINGGWSGTPGSKTIVKTSPSIFENASVDILHWNAPITISDIVVTGVTTNWYEAYALSVQTGKGGITLNRVQVIDNYDLIHPMGGAHLDTSAATAGHPAPVTVNDSVFNSNYGSGLYIQSGGAVKFHNLTADNNGDSSINGDGAYIDNRGPNPNQPVTLTGTNEFKVNFGTGLDILSTGAVSLNNITAIYNDNGIGSGYGMYITNYDGSTPSIVKLTGTNWFAHNAIDGLYIESNGNIYLNNITASFNGGNGASIYNDYNLLKAQPVTISGTNGFNDNANGGLVVGSYGAIKLSNITADDNASNYGAYLDNRGYSSISGGTGVAGATVITRVPVTLTGVNTFNHNFIDGLEIMSVGAISVSNITASDNGTVAGGPGVFLENSDDWYPNFGAKTPYAANVTISGFGTFENNGYIGLIMYSAGTVKLANLTVDNNGSDGAVIETRGFLAPQSVTLTGVNAFDKNHGSGLYIYDNGKIAISNLDASNNGIYGAALYNSNGDTLTGFNTFQNNLGLYGLYIHTDGSATMSHINADENTGTGVYVHATRNVTLVCGSAADNGSTGFDLTSGATMTLTGVNAYYNHLLNEALTYPVGALHRTASCP